MAVECVERHPTEDGIAQCGHLFELVARSGLAAGPIPWPPFVDHQLYPVLRILLAHDLPVSVDQSFHTIAFAQQLIPVDCLEIESVALPLIPVLRLSAAEIPRLVVPGHSIDGAECVFSLARDFF